MHMIFEGGGLIDITHWVVTLGQSPRTREIILELISPQGNLQ